jgi:hypothetical protein
MEVNRETRGRGENIEDRLQVAGRIEGGATEDECIVSVLKDGAWEVGGERVAEVSTPPSLTDEALEDVYHNDKKIGGEGITLAEAITTTDPVAGHPVKEDSRVTS